MYDRKQVKFKLLSWVFHGSSSTKLVSLNIQPDFSLKQIWFQVAGCLPILHFLIPGSRLLAVPPAQESPYISANEKWTFPLRPRLRPSLHHWSVLDQHSHWGWGGGGGSFLFSISRASQLYSKIWHTMQIVFHIHSHILHNVLQTKLQFLEPNIVLGIQCTYNQSLQSCFYNETSDSDFLKVGNEIWLALNCTGLKLLCK